MCLNDKENGRYAEIEFSLFGVKRLLLQYAGLPCRPMNRPCLLHADDRVVDLGANCVFLLPQADLGLTALQQRRGHVGLRAPVFQRDRHLYADLVIREIAPEELCHACAQPA